MSLEKLKIGVVGATGLVGETFLKLLRERQTPIEELRLFASEGSSGQTLAFGGQKLSVSALKPDSFAGLDVVFFSAGESVSAEWAPRAVKAGAWAIDNSSAFRMDSDTLLCVPEINGHELRADPTPRIVANPNCSTIQLVLALNPLLRDFGLDSVIVSTYQAVSGAGREAQGELLGQLNNSDVPAKVFPVQVAFNAIPQIGSFSDNGFCSEELKIMSETKKILNAPSNLRVSAMTVRIPALNSHSESVWVRLGKKVSRAQILDSLRAQEGVLVNEALDSYPTAHLTSGTNPVHLGRLHQDLDDPQTWIFWLVADNLRKGAALNGLQIAERIFDINPRP